MLTVVGTVIQFGFSDLTNQVFIHSTNRELAKLLIGLRLILQ